MDTITSKSNEKVKYIKSLNEKKFRQKYNAFYIEGIKVVSEILNYRRAMNIKFIAYSKEILLKLNGGEDILNIIQKNSLNIELLSLSKELFEYITDTKTPQGILAVIDMQNKSLKDIDFENNIIILDKIQDAGNIGTIIRTAEAFDINNIICIEGTTDIYSPKVVRSTMGSIFRENIVYVKEQEIDEMVEVLKKHNFNIFATTLDKSTDLENISFDLKSAFIFGNEANGVSDKLKYKADKNVKINMSLNTDSLNVSIAAGIVMYKQYIEKRKK